MRRPIVPRAFLSPQLVFPDKGDVCGKGGFTGDLVGSFAGSWAVNFANANTVVIIPIVQKQCVCPP